VKVTGGTVTGVQTEGLSEFKGIPFAAPPVGALRWKAPAPVEPWNGIKEANAFGPACMQNAAMAKQMGHPGTLSEDCLYLNVWTPAKTANAKLPVIVWIYGGGFTGGMTSTPLYDGAHFAQRGVVLVSIAYRVGPMGFLATPELSKESGHGSGSWGMLDQVAGLKWVQANIAKFGGDPAKVTILGHSAGAYAVSILAASPLAKGLFRGVIAESGANFGPAQSAAEQGGLQLRTLAFAEADGTAFLDRLGVHNLAEARALPAQAVQDGKGGRFWPPLDGYVLPADQAELWKSRKFNDVSVLVGSTSDETAAFGARQSTSDAFIKTVRDGYGASADTILAAYRHDTPEDATRAAKWIGRDTTFGWPAWSWATLQTRYGKGRAYVYYWDKPSAQNPDGSGHGSEVGYVFGTYGTRMPNAGEEDKAISDRLQRYWVNFATNLDPNGSGLRAWPAFDAAQPMVMRLGSNEGASPYPNRDKMEALDLYYAWRRTGGK
jgi:para-nitrobenzyl esterase